MSDGRAATERREDESRDENTMHPALRQVVREAREHFDPAKADSGERDGKPAGADVDWDRLEASLMSRVEAERQIERFGGARGVWGAAAAALAVAAAAALLLGRTPASSSIDADAQLASQAPEVAGLAARQGGDVRINGASASTGHALRVGDTIEIRGATKAIFDRPARNQRGGVTWTLEEAQLASSRDAASARAVVKSVGGSGVALVMALEHGAIEAEVTPVAQGEAFAIDVADLRVAVHGTHLRVARAGTRVVVDLTEGIVSLGRAPRVGSTYGKLVNAPAHVEIDLERIDLDNLDVQVQHDKESVRAASPLREFVSSAMHPSPSAQLAPAQPSSAHNVQRPALASKKDDKRNDPALAAVAPDPHPQEAIVHAIKVCAQAKPLPNGVSMTVTSTLQLKVNDDGSVESARFDPPLSPEVQSCAATTIYKTRFAQPGWVQIPFELQK
jgi:ferric-dicitrate binding protein FerR (iron transport regulator)